MIGLAESDDFSPKKIADDLFERCKQAKAWFIYCYIEESWISNGLPLPFDMRIVDGIVGCRVICTTYSEAQTIVANILPVIKFIEEPEEDNE
jgi:hypothetical protein